ncbi:MAG: polymer-forming cytoskeletal protein [Candidatus Eremiobacteraeota bacterium]|nr:polymer-forming cytoskeletal protein [Candidatus Eremiobacteraeota bacterium]
MNYISREEFEEHHPRRKEQTLISEVYPGNLTVDTDMRITGAIQGDVRVINGTQAAVTGVINGLLKVEPGGVVYMTGVVEGDIQIEGSALLLGVVRGKVAGSEEAHFATGGSSEANRSKDSWPLPGSSHH